MGEIRVLLGHTQPAVRHGLRGILLASRGIGVLESGRDRYGRTQALARADVLVLESEQAVSWPWGAELAGGAGPVSCLVVSAAAGEEAILAAVLAGVAGYLLLDEPAERIVAAVRGVARGERGWYSRPVAALLARCLGEALRSRRLQARPHAVQLTPRETEVLRALAEGGTNLQMAQALGISVWTVRFHLKNIYDKLGVDTRGQAMVWAMRWGYGVG